MITNHKKQLRTWYLVALLVFANSCAHREREFVDTLQECRPPDRITTDGWTVLSDTDDPIVVAGPPGFSRFNRGYSLHHGGTTWRRDDIVLERTNAWGEYAGPDDGKPCRTAINGVRAVIFEGRRSIDAAYGIVAWYFLPRPWYDFRQRSIEAQPVLAGWSKESDDLPILRAMIYAVRANNLRPDPPAR
jgi:hypothetical protein